VILPNKIFFTGAPGSKWSGIAQVLEEHPQFNTTDRTPERTYTHHSYAGHKGAYFGTGMEFEADPYIVPQAYEDPAAGTMIAKSHEWLFGIPGYLEAHSVKHNAWTMLVYRPNDLCMEWWQAAGGFGITYPDYKHYTDNSRMAYCIREQNEAMLRFAFYKNLKWDYFTSKWIDENFGIKGAILPRSNLDTLVTIYRP